MRTKVLRRVMVAVTLVAVPALLAASPAHAAVRPAAAQVGTAVSSPPRAAALPTIPVIISAVQQVYSLIRSLSQNTISVEEATGQILAAINTAKTEIIAHIDAIATAQARGCARSTIIDFADFEAFTPDNRQAFARDATACLVLADSLQRAVTDKAAANELGFALNAVGPIALIARSRSGLSVTSLTQDLVAANLAVTTKLFPRCTATYEGRFLDYWTCIAFNGDRATQGDDRASTADRATANTSRAVAQAALRQLAA